MLLHKNESHAVFTFRRPRLAQVDDEEQSDELLRLQNLDLRGQVPHQSRHQLVALQVVGVQRVRDAQLRLVSPG